MIKVYIASPHAIGDQAYNVGKSMAMASFLIDCGYLPIWPLCAHFLHMHYPKPREKWMQIDFELLAVCNCILRMPGESVGADQEEAEAKRLGIPVFYSTSDLLSYYRVAG